MFSSNLSSVLFQDSSPLIRRLFLDKTHKLLKEHAIPSRYACAFVLAGPDCPKDLQEDVGLCPCYYFVFIILVAF